MLGRTFLARLSKVRSSTTATLPTSFFCRGLATTRSSSSSRLALRAATPTSLTTGQSVAAILTATVTVTATWAAPYCSAAADDVAASASSTPTQPTITPPITPWRDIPLVDVVPATSLDDVVSFWLSLDPSDWFSKNEAFDNFLLARYGKLHAEVLALSDADFARLLVTPESRFAVVLLLDQMTRNMFRNSAKMYCADVRGLQAARAICDAGDYEGVDCPLFSKTHNPSLHTYVVMFASLPFQHSEVLADQQQCLDIVCAHCPDSTQVQSYAQRHYDIVKQWNRFPHRNDILGRAYADGEREFLKDPANSF